MGSLFNRKDSGLVDLNAVYHLIKSEVKNISKRIFNVPYGEVMAEGKPNIHRVTLSNISHGTTDTNAMPASHYFIAKPTQYEIVPIFKYLKQSFYGHPLPIHGSEKNHAKLRLVGTDNFSPNLVGTKKIEIAPGDVVVQGRQNHSMTFGKTKALQTGTIRIGNDIFGRSKKKGFLSDEYIQRASEDLNFPIFYNPNIDGSSIYMLNQKNAGIDLEIEVELSGNKEHKRFYERSLINTFNTERNDSLNKVLIASDHLIFYTKGLDDPIGHDINMLASGNVFINSFRNVIIATPSRKDDGETEIGTVRIGNGEEPTGLPLSTMQPIVKGVDFQEAMVEVVSLFNFVRSQFKSLANGGIGVDRHGVGHANSLKGAPIKVMDMKIKSLEKLLSRTLSDKVYTE
jgi:hypothetical protein